MIPMIKKDNSNNSSNSSRSNSRSRNRSNNNNNRKINAIGESETTRWLERAANQ